MDALNEIPKFRDKRPIPNLQGTVKLQVCLEDRVIKTTAYIAAIRHSQIGRDLINELEPLAANWRGLYSGGVLTHTQHPRPTHKGTQHSTEPALSHGAVKRIRTGNNISTPSGCVSVPGANLTQSKHVPRAEHVDGRKHTPLTVDEGLDPHTVQTILCKLLFPVGSLVLARMTHGTRGLMPSRNLMHVEMVLGRYDYILSDGKRWSARRLIRIRRTAMKTGT